MLNLYDQLKDHPRFPDKYKEDQGVDTEMSAHNEAIDKFIEFLKTVGVDEEKVMEAIPYRCTIVCNKNIRKNIASAICQSNIIGDKK